MMRMMVTGKKEEEMRKGPWTEEEDAQLVCCVGLFGERRWDVIARVSGLNRTGKSCRLRWVNYLHPGLKRGRITPQEEKLILDLHARWGNRWSRIARKLPGRTDNEIKNYWRTLMRKKAQERKDSTSTTTTTCSPPSISGSHSYSSLSSSSSLSSICSPPPSNGATGGLVEDEKVNGVDWSYPMDKIWEDMVSSEMSGLCGQGYDIGCTPLPPSPLWEYSCESLWQMDDDQERAQCGGAPSVWEWE